MSDITIGDFVGHISERVEITAGNRCFYDDGSMFPKGVTSGLILDAAVEREVVVENIGGQYGAQSVLLNGESGFEDRQEIV
jgi:hypothetical protein